MPDLSKIKLNNTTYNLKDAALRERYGVCSTAGDTAAKTVSIPSVTSLYEGLYIFVKFANANAIASPTLQVNSLDAKLIKRYGTTAPSTSAASSWNAGSVVLLIYDGNYWQMEEWNNTNTTYSSMTTSEISAGTGTTARIITPARLKTAIETWAPAAPVQSVNGATGAVVIDALKTTAADSNTEYDLIGTAQSNTDTAAVAVYRPTFLSVAKTDDLSRLTIGSTTKPGVLRLYSSASSATGYIDLKSGSSSTNTRTITLPDATGTVALTSDIPNVSAWALAANKPSYTFSELTTTPTSLGGYGITDAYTKTEVDGMVSGVLHYKGTKATVAALPSSGNTTGDVWHVTADGSEWAWDGSDWQELGTAVDLSGYVPTSRTVNGKALTSDISLTASDVSALPSNTTYVSSFNGSTGAITYTAPVTSVNGQTGAVTISDSDEKLKTNLLDQTISNMNYKLVLTDSTSTANTKYYDIGLDYQTRVDEHTARLSIGVSGTGDNRRTGQLALYNQDKYCIIRNTATTNSGYYINMPSSGGTLALTSDIPSVPSWALESSKPTYTASEVGALPDTTVIPDADDHKWGGVALAASGANTSVDSYVPSMSSASNTTGTAYWARVTHTPTNYCIAKYDGGAYLYSTTPSASDNSTKVATTAYVDSAVSGITDTNTTYTISISGNVITLTPSSGTAQTITLPVYNGGVS